MGILTQQKAADLIDERAIPVLKWPNSRVCRKNMFFNCVIDSVI